MSADFSIRAEFSAENRSIEFVRGNKYIGNKVECISEKGKWEGFTEFCRWLFSCCGCYVPKWVPIQIEDDGGKNRNFVYINSDDFIEQHQDLLTEGHTESILSGCMDNNAVDVARAIHIFFNDKI